MGSVVTFSCLHEPPPKPPLPVFPPVDSTNILDSLFPGGIIVDLPYPDSLIGQYDLKQIQKAGWEWDPTSWPGKWGWGEKERLDLYWEGRVTGHKLRLGIFEGYVSITRPSDDSIAEFPYRIHRRFKNFCPAGDSLSEYWGVTTQPKDFSGDRQLLAQVVDAATPIENQVRGIRSRFAFVGDYVFDIHLRLPATVASGYTVALFLSEVEAPLFQNILTGKGEQKGFQVFSEGAGIFFNAEKGQNPVKAFGPGDRFSGLGIRLANDVTFRFIRKEGRISFASKGPTESDFTEIQGWFYPDLSALDAGLFLHMMVGVFEAPTRTLNVEWDRFVIHEGEVEMRP